MHQGEQPGEIAGTRADQIDLALERPALVGIGLRPLWPGADHRLSVSLSREARLVPTKGSGC